MTVEKNVKLFAKYSTKSQVNLKLVRMESFTFKLWLHPNFLNPMSGNVDQLTVIRRDL